MVHKGTSRWTKILPHWESTRGAVISPPRGPSREAVISPAGGVGVGVGRWVEQISIKMFLHM